MFENYFCAYCTLAYANRPSQADFSAIQKEKRQTFRSDVSPGRSAAGGRILRDCFHVKDSLRENCPKRTRFKDSSFLSSAEFSAKAENLLDKSALLC